MDIVAVATARLASLIKEVRILSNRSKTFSVLRLVSFFLFLFCLYQYTNGLVWAGWLGVLLLFSFVFFITRHNDLNKQRKLVRQKIKINEDEIARARGMYPEHPDGSEFQSDLHPFADDLDLFGPKSLFYHINRCVLASSRQSLASYLTDSVNSETAKKRQEALVELQERLEWRQDLQAVLGQLSKEEGSDQIILNSNFQQRQPGWFEPLAAISLSITTITLIVLSMMDFLALGYPVLMCLVNFIVLAQYNLRLQKKVLETDKLFTFLAVFSKSIEIIGIQSFRSSILKDHQVNLSSEATGELKRLRQIVFLLESRGNMMWSLVNILLLIDMYSGWALKRWLSRNQTEMKSWLNSLNHFEVFGSFATYWDQNPHFIFPEFTQHHGTWQGFAVGHPLIPEHKRVTNDLEITQPVALVTGSNMSGKSTFLRTVGINTVMAWAGLPVCAEKLTLSRFQVFTSMRTHDDLSQETSSFYAELKRLKQLFSLIDDSDGVVLFLLDEILKGTNSHDRHIGARGIVERLSQKDVKGFISTHDLTLADEYEDHDLVINYSFNSQMVGSDELNFDYKLTKGKCQSTNASILMKQMGIIN